MPEPVIDQAAGLRQLFRRPAGRFVGTVRPQNSAAHAVTVAKLAHALARQSQRVLVLDETGGAHAISRVLGLSGSYDLLDAIQGQVDLSRACIEGPGGVRVLQAPELARTLPRLNGNQRRVLREAIGLLRRRADLILVNVDAGETRQSLLQVADEVMVLLTPAVGDITAAYGALKRLAAQNPRRDFSAIVVGSSCDVHGLAVFNNVREAAREHLGVELTLRGVLPDRSRPDDDILTLRDFSNLSASIEEVAQSLLYGQKSAARASVADACAS